MGADGCLDDDEMLAFATGQLEPRRRKEVIAHVDGCDGCRELAAELARDADAPEDEGVEPPPSELPSMSRLAGGQLVSGRFLLDAPLGKGATATVFRAHDKELGIDVALKMVRRDEKGETRRAFARELKVGRKIGHPNVCKLFDTGSTAQYDFITMELVEGRSLAQLLGEGPLPRTRAMEILGGIAAGLGAAHALGVVHRDLKPANVMIEEKTGRVVLTDFGLAMDLDTKQSRKLVGTPAYWAPEQARGEAASPRSDVYSFGVLAYRLLAGKDFSMSDDASLDAVPRDLRRVVAKCVELHPRERFADANAVAAALGGARGPRWPFALGLTAAAAAAVFAVWPRGATSPAREPVVADPGPALTAQPPATTQMAVTTAEPVPSTKPAEPPPILSSSANATSTAAAHPPIMKANPRASASARTNPAPVSSEGADLLFRK